MPSNSIPTCRAAVAEVASVCSCVAVLFAIPSVHAQPCVSTVDVTASIGGAHPNSPDTQLVWDSAAGRILAFIMTPDDRQGPLVSAYNGVVWTPLPRAGQMPPGEGSTGSWVFDSTRGYALLFGGSPATYSPSLQTWSFGAFTNTLRSYNGSSWQQLTWTGTSPPAGFPFCGFDALRGRAIFVFPRPGLPLHTYQVWEWTGTAWEEGPISGPTLADGFAFDSVRRVGLLGGAREDSPGHLRIEDMWYYLPGATAAQGSWQQVAIATGGQDATTHSTYVYDPFRARVLKCGGYTHTALGDRISTQRIDVWMHDSSDWSRADQADDFAFGMRRGEMGAAYDLNRDKVVIYGGARIEDVVGSPGVLFRDTLEQSRQSPGVASATSGVVAVCQGQSTVLAVAPVGEPAQIRWFRGVQEIPGATGPLLQIGPVTSADAGTYHATLYHACGAYAVPNVTLRVDPPITFDAPTFWPGSCTTCPGGTVTIIPPVPSAASQAGPPLRLHLQRQIAGNWTDVQVASPGDAFALGPLDPVHAGDYRVVVDGNACPPVVESTRRIEVGIQIDVQPQSQTVAPCSPVVLSVSARGTCIQSYQWLKGESPITNGGRISGAQTGTLVINGARYEDEGIYRCRVTDVCDLLESVGATVSLTTPTWRYGAPMTSAPRIFGTGTSSYWMSAFDESRSVMVMYGGQTSTGGVANSLWEYDGVEWVARQDAFDGVVTGTGQPLFDTLQPPNPAASALVYNPDDSKIYLVAVRSAAFPLAICTWNGTQWARPYYGPVGGDTSRTHAAYDRVNHRIVIVRAIGGSNAPEMLIYDPVSGQMAGPTPLQGVTGLGVHAARLWYDEHRARCIWYNNLSEFVPPRIWSLQGSSWGQAFGDAPIRFGEYSQLVYDPVRLQVVSMGGFWDGASWYTGTHAWPDDLFRHFDLVALANRWMTILPDGAPRNPGGAGISPLNNWSPARWSAVAFDRRRRAMVAPGLDNYSIFSGGPAPAWRTYERRYEDAVEFDRPLRTEVQAPGNVVVFRAHAAGYSTGGLVFQWRKNGVTLINGPAAGGGMLSGTHTGTLMITGVGPADEGAYTCVVTGACGSRTTEFARLGCGADFNGIGGVSVADIFAYLIAWFANDLSADFNGSGTVSVADIFAFLTAWFGGCP